MNRTLNRPMFRRGGKVDSRGTGITSGLMPRQNYAVGDLVKQISPGMSQAIGGDISLAGTTIPSIPTSTQAAEYLYNQPSTFFPKLKSGVTDFLLGENLKADSEKNVNNLIEQQKQSQEKAIQNILENRATDNKITDVEGTPEQTPDEDPRILFPDEIDFDQIEKDIERKGEFYERLLKRDKKGQVFEALTAAAPKLLDEDYGGAIKDAGEKLKDDTKREARLLAIQESITNQNKETDLKKINSVAKTLFNSGEYETLADAKAAATKIVYRVPNDKPNKYDDSQNIINQIASIDESGNAHERQFKESYAVSRVEYANNPSKFTLAQYTKKDPKDVNSGYGSNITQLINSDTTRGKIIIDPRDNTYISVNKQGEMETFTTSAEAEAHLNS